MKSLKISFVLIALFMVCPLMADSIVYFGLSTQVPSDLIQGTKICVLDNTTVILKNINDELKTNSMVDPKIISNTYEARFQAISDSAVCQFQAGKLGINALPAIVLNNEYVVYGQTDITTATQEIQAYLEEQHVG